MDSSLFFKKYGPKDYSYTYQDKNLFLTLDSGKDIIVEKGHLAHITTIMTYWIAYTALNGNKNNIPLDIYYITHSDTGGLKTLTNINSIIEDYQESQWKEAVKRIRENHKVTQEDIHETKLEFIASSHQSGNIKLSNGNVVYAISDIKKNLNDKSGDGRGLVVILDDAKYNKRLRSSGCNLVDFFVEKGYESGQVIVVDTVKEDSGVYDFRELQEEELDAYFHSLTVANSQKDIKESNPEKIEKEHEDNSAGCCAKHLEGTTLHDMFNDGNENKCDCHKAKQSEEQRLIDMMTNIIKCIETQQNTIGKMGDSFYNIETIIKRMTEHTKSLLDRIDKLESQVKEMNECQGNTEDTAGHDNDTKDMSSPLGRPWSTPSATPYIPYYPFYTTSTNHYHSLFDTIYSILV